VTYSCWQIRGLPDGLVARCVRDEIREISPGVYLGLVFLWRYHILDFALDFSR
jgi:hypothetical protein